MIVTGPFTYDDALAGCATFLGATRGAAYDALHVRAPSRVQTEAGGTAYQSTADSRVEGRG
jgi:hypothetical protein